MTEIYEAHQFPFRLKHGELSALCITDGIREPLLPWIMTIDIDNANTLCPELKMVIEEMLND